MGSETSCTITPSAPSSSGCSTYPGCAGSDSAGVSISCGPKKPFNFNGGKWSLKT